MGVRGWGLRNPHQYIFEERMVLKRGHERYNFGVTLSACGQKVTVFALTSDFINIQ